MSHTTVDNKLWDIRLYMMRKYGCDSANALFAPLEWYITTDRASLSFLRWLISAKTFVIARSLAKGGSYDDAINRLKAKADC